MKNLVLLIVGLFCFSTSHADSDAKLDLSRGTIRTCDANSGEIGEAVGYFGRCFDAQRAA